MPNFPDKEKKKENEQSKKNWRTKEGFVSFFEANKHVPNICPGRIEELRKVYAFEFFFENLCDLLSANRGYT